MSKNYNQTLNFEKENLNYNETSPLLPYVDKRGEDYASWFNKLTFNWLKPLLALGNKVK